LNLNPLPCFPTSLKFLSRLRVFAWIAVPVCMSSIHVHAADAPNAQREAAVVQARNGDARGALTALQQLLEQYPDDARLLVDTGLVANWAGDDALVLDIYARAQTPKDDDQIVEAAARSARNLHRYDQAIELFRRAQTLDESRWQPYLGEAMTMIDKGIYSAAVVLMEPLVREHGQEKDVILGQAYLCSRQADFACSIAMYERYLEQSPSDTQVHNNLAQTLSRVGGQNYASQLYSPGVSADTLDTEYTLSQAAAGEHVRWGEAFAPTRALQRAESETALERLNRVIAGSTPKDIVWQSAQYDRLVVLYDLNRMRENEQLYRQLLQQKLNVPPYALLRVAQMYLALHKPERAEALYRELVRQTPTDGRVWGGLAYAQLESQQYRKAFTTIDHAYQNSATWLRTPGLGELKGNQMRMELESQSAEMRGYADLLGEEQKRMEAMVAEAPANENLRWQLAMSYLARDWPKRALKESKIADNYATRDEIPSLPSMEIHEGAGLRDDADAMLPIVRERQGDNLAFTRYLRDRAIERGWQFDVDTAFGFGDGLQVGSSDQLEEAHLYTPLINNRWRIYALGLRDSGDFEVGVGSAEHTRVGLGFRYDYNRQTVWGEVAHDFGTNILAGHIGTKLSLGDYFTLNIEGDTDSFDAPVRAITSNVRARSVDVTLGWRASELQSANVTLQRVLFSDGNQRAMINSDWTMRLWTSPRWQFSLGALESASSNSLDEERSYFNPKHDVSAGPRGTLDWLTWRRYDHNFRQEVEVYAAPYWQEDYGTHGSVSVRYGHRWKMREGLESRWGVTWTNQPYDGVSERRIVVDTGISWGTP
jgi:biofilm PGA synthesis protein PgaA